MGQYRFAVDGRTYETDERFPTGEQIRRMVSLADGDQLFEEGEGDNPHRHILDGDFVCLDWQLKILFTRHRES